MDLSSILFFFEEQIKKGGFDKFKANFLDIDTSDLSLDEDEIVAFDTEDEYIYVGASHDGICSTEDEGFMSLKYVSLSSEKIRNKKLSLYDYQKRINNAITYEEYRLYNSFFDLYKKKVQEIKEKIHQSLPSNCSQGYINSFLNIMNDRITSLSMYADSKDFEILNEDDNYVNIILITLEKLKEDLRSLFEEIKTANNRQVNSSVSSRKENQNSTLKQNTIEKYKKISTYYTKKQKELGSFEEAEKATLNEFVISEKTLNRALKSS